MVEVKHELSKVYYTYGYGKAILYSLPLTNIPGPATVVAVPQYSQLTMNQIVLINPNATNVTVQILDGNNLVFATSVPAGGQIVLDNPLNFFDSLVINPTGPVFVYGHGTLYLPPSF